MNEHKSSAGGRVSLGIIVIIIGTFFLMHSMGYLDFHISRMIWPMILVVAGILILINSRKKIIGVILLVIGSLLSIERMFPEIDFNHGVIIPVLIILLGIYIISMQRRGGQSGNSKESFINRDTIDDVAVFGGGTKVFSTDSFKGGSITSIFGGSEIDLTGCKLAEGENVIDVLFIFGGSEIYVPNDWNVISNMTPVFGGFSNKIRRDPNMAVDTSRTLVIKGLALFGGGEIKSKF